VTETISDVQQPQQKTKNNQQKCQLLISSGWPSNSWHREGVASRARHPPRRPHSMIKVSPRPQTTIDGHDADRDATALS
jgi:hypothetical protein